MNVEEIRTIISKNIGKKVIVKTYGLRNKNFKYTGVIDGVYPYIFTIICEGTQKSFSYADVITKEVVIELIWFLLIFL